MTDSELFAMTQDNRALWRQPFVPIRYLLAAERMFGVMLNIFYAEGFMRVRPRGVDVPVYGPGARVCDSDLRARPSDDDYMMVTHEEAEQLGAP